MTLCDNDFSKSHLGSNVLEVLVEVHHHLGLLCYHSACQLADTEGKNINLKADQENFHLNFRTEVNMRAVLTR